MKYLKLFESETLTKVNKLTFKKVKEDEYFTVSAFLGNEVVGDATFHVEVDDYYIMIDDIIVNNPQNGIGTQLMNKCLDIIKKDYPNINIIMLDASPIGANKMPLPKLVEFYQRFGFEVYKPEGNNVIMIKEY